jgi:hypothetical protein
MNFLNKWILRKANQLERQDHAIKMSSALAGAQHIPVGRVSLDSPALHFKVYKASGGYIVETNQYNHKTDRHNNGLHIITSDKDLGQEIGKIITLECLKA